MSKSLLKNLASLGAAALMLPLAWSLPAQAQEYPPPTQIALPPPLSLTDVWTGVDSSGWGVSLTQSDDFLYAIISVYDAAGRPVWYTGEMKWQCAPEDTSTGCLYAFSGPAYRTSSGAPVNMLPPGPVGIESVGTIRFTPPYVFGGVGMANTVTSGALELAVDGKTLRQEIRRLTLTRPVLRLGSFASLITVSKMNCFSGGSICNSSLYYYSQLSFEEIYVFGTDGGSSIYALRFTNNDGVPCSIKGPLGVDGPFYEIRDGAFECVKNDTPTLQTTATLKIRFSATGTTEGEWTSKEKDGYSETGVFGGVWQPSP